MSERPVVAITRPGLWGEPEKVLGAIADVRVWQDAKSPPTTDEIASLAADATAMLCQATDKMSDELMARLPKLKLIALSSVGYDAVDVAAATRRGIAVTNTPGVLNEVVADTAFGLMLAARRRLAEGDRFVRAGKWNEISLRTLVGLDVHGMTLGLIGYGGIGKAVARRAKGFDMRVLYFDPYRNDDGNATYTELDELLRVSDTVSIHTPLMPGTRGLLGEKEFRAMKPTATLINTARGGVVDQPALIRALREGWIGSAGIDVQVVEPNPDTNDPLLSTPNLVVLPHIGSASEASRVALVMKAVSNIEAVLAGKPPVSPVKG